MEAGYNPYIGPNCAIKSALAVRGGEKSWSVTYGVR